MDKRRTKLDRTRRALTVEQEETIEAASMTLDRALQDFVNAKAAERLATRTIRDYKRHFRYLHEWLRNHYGDIGLAEVTTQMLREYISWMSNEKERYGNHPHRSKRGRIGLAPETVNIRIRSMKSFFKWCVAKGTFQPRRQMASNNSGLTWRE